MPPTMTTPSSESKQKTAPLFIPPQPAMKKTEFNKRFEALRAEGLLWRPAWMEMTKYIDQLRGIFDTMPQKRAQLPDFQTIIDNHATWAANVLASGLMSGMTSPSMPWLRVTLDNLKEIQTPAIRQWLDAVQDIIYQILDKSNVYGSLHHCYKELPWGTGCFSLLEDFEDVCRTQSYTIGEYWLGIDNKGRVNSFAREFWMQVGPLVEEFGYDNCSPQVRNHFDYNQPDVWIKVRNLIEPNKTRLPMMADFKNMPIRSIYWDNADHSDVFLALRGFERFPIIAPRWETITTDSIYGKGPGWQALGDIKQLQKTVLDKLLAQEKIHNPPVQKDASIEGSVWTIPGGVTTSNAMNLPNAGVRATYQIQNAQLESFMNLINDIKQAINKAFYVDLFQMMSQLNSTTMRTAAEISERKQEQIMLMGPILYNLKVELLNPLIEGIYTIALKNNLLPPPPKEIAGMPVKIEYISVLAQAERALGVTQISNVIGFVASFNQLGVGMGQHAARVLDLDEAVREASEMIGIPARLIKDPAVVAQEDAAAAKQAQMQQMAMSAEPMSKAAKNLGDANTTDPASGKPTALGQMLKANGVGTQ
jgi:hypothetical protein